MLAFSQPPLLYFMGYIMFRGNHGIRGGALSLTPFSLVYLRPNTTVYFVNYTAGEYGGAVYISDQVYEIDEGFILCNLYPLIPPNMPLEEAGIQVIFINNTAGIAGDALYGGYIDFCKDFYILSYAQTDGDSLIWQYPSSLVYNLTLKYSTEYSL